MARIAYTDLLLDWTPGAATPLPIQANITKLIANVYREVYTIMYPTQNLYTATDTTDTDGLVVNDHVFGKLLSLIGSVVEDWHNAGSDEGGDFRFINFKLPEKIVKELKSWKNTYLLIKNSLLGNARLWGSEVRDYYRLGH